MKARDWLN